MTHFSHFWLIFSLLKICPGWFYFYVRFVFSDSKYIRIAGSPLQHRYFFFVYLCNQGTYQVEETKMMYFNIKMMIFFVTLTIYSLYQNKIILIIFLPLWISWELFNYHWKTYLHSQQLIIVNYSCFQVEDGYNMDIIW